MTSKIGFQVSLPMVQFLLYFIYIASKEYITTLDNVRHQ